MDFRIPVAIGATPLPCVTAWGDAVCDRFEAAWKKGQRPSIEQYLAEGGPTERATLLKELLLLELEYRTRQGERPAAAEYRRRFPDDEHFIDEILPESRLAKTVCRLGDSSRVLVARKKAGACSAADSRYVSLLARTWPLSELPESVIRAMAERVQEKEFTPGDALIRQGRTSRYLAVLVEGTVNVSVRSPQRPCHVATLHGRAILGEMGLLTEEPCTASVTAATPVRILALSAREFRRLAARYPSLSLALNRLVAKRLGSGEVDILVGKTLQGFRVKRYLGRGGTAIVYEAEERAGGRRVALKMMSHSFAHDLEMQRRFQRELEICRALCHPNILEIDDCFTAFGTNVLVLEFCDGLTLDELIRHEGPLPEGEVRWILIQLARALSYAHRRGVCHRDLKPSNVMLDRQGTLKLMDFGMARSACSPELTAQGSILGTPRYMAPEQLAGARVDFRADKFAFGSIAYEMLTGQPLFPEADYGAILARQLSWSLPPADQIREGLSPDLYAVLRQSLAIRPDDRTLDLTKLAKTCRAQAAVDHETVDNDPFQPHTQGDVR